MKRLSCLLFLALAVPCFADPPPQVYIPTPPPVIPPTPPIQTIVVPVGDFVPLYVDKTLKARVKLSDPTVFCKPHLKLAAGATHSGILFSDPLQMPSIFTMASDGYILVAMRAGTTTLTVDANGDNGPVDLYTVQLVVGTPPPPIPPTPPGPVDPLTAALQIAVTADKATAAEVKALADVCNSVASVKLTGQVTKLSQLQSVMSAAANLASGGSMPATLKVASTYISTKLPSVDQPMTDALWATAIAAYGDVATALGKVQARGGK